jgi:hypothetical protein
MNEAGEWTCLSRRCRLHKTVQFLQAVPPFNCAVDAGAMIFGDAASLVPDIRDAPFTLGSARHGPCERRRRHSRRDVKRDD